MCCCQLRNTVQNMITSRSAYSSVEAFSLSFVSNLLVLEAQYIVRRSWFSSIRRTFSSVYIKIISQICGEKLGRCFFMSTWLWSMCNVQNYEKLLSTCVLFQWIVFLIFSPIRLEVLLELTMRLQAIWCRSFGILPWPPMMMMTKLGGLSLYKLYFFKATLTVVLAVALDALW